MGNIERYEAAGQPTKEVCLPNHFYAAYIFDQPNSHQKDIHTIIDEAAGLGYPVRYWWLSQAMDIQNCPDRLIVCVHHSSGGENAGMDLYERLHTRGTEYEELEAAAMEEYVFLGKGVSTVETIKAGVADRPGQWAAYFGALTGAMHFADGCGTRLAPAIDRKGDWPEWKVHRTHQLAGLSRAEMTRTPFRKCV